MSTEGRPEANGENLIAALAAAGDDLAALIAILWTWLEAHMRELGSLREPTPSILDAAYRAPRFERLDAELLAWIEEEPLRNAAELLARIGFRFLRVTLPIVELRSGFDGEERMVAWRGAPLAKRLGGEYPPSAQEHPSLTTLAPTLAVSSISVNQIELRSVSPDGPGWELAERLLARGVSGATETTLEIHLDTLGPHGLSGVRQSETFEVGRYDAALVDPEDHERCIEAAREAVRLAAGDASILVMPELAATPDVLAAVRDEIARASFPPALTVVGLYHRRAPEPPLPSDVVSAAKFADYVNEAVVLGPDGGELWRHRKLCRAEARGAGGARIVEDIRLGAELAIVRTALGNLSILLCLDAFAAHARDRVLASPANVLLVPSLSPTVARHASSLQQLVQGIWGVAFVCNRSPIVGPGAPSNWNHDKNRSFWALQRSPLRPCVPRPEGGHPSFVISVGTS
jgi:predicted amidohydrolase